MGKYDSDIRRYVEKTYSVSVGKYSLRDASIVQLNNLYEVINDFLEKEKEFVAAINYKSNGDNEVIIEKEISFSWNREIHTNYCILTDHENLQELTPSQLFDLYNTLKAFLFNSEIEEIKQCRSKHKKINKNNASSDIEIKEDFIRDGDRVLKSSAGISKTVRISKIRINFDVEYTIYLNDGVIQELSFNNLLDLQNAIFQFLKNKK